jgi:hypothetical protein
VVNAPDLSPRLRATLDAFEASGVTLSHEEVVWLAELRRPCDNPSDGSVPLSHEEVVWLAELRRPCDNPSDGSVPWVMGAPLEYGGIRWYPNHRLADGWFLRAYALMDGDPQARLVAYLYAHAHSAPGDVSLRELTTVESMERVLSEWFDALPIQDAQLEPLCVKLRELDGETKQVPDHASKYGDADVVPDDPCASFASAMCHAFPGTTPEYWLTEISTADAKRILTGASTGGFAESDDRRESIANYLKAVKWIWKRHTDG